MEVTVSAQSSIWARAPIRPPICVPSVHYNLHSKSLRFPV